MATREDFEAAAGGLDKAIAFEHATLLCGDEFLPAFALAVRYGGEAGPEYWAWLIECLAQEERDFALSEVSS